MSSPVSQHHAVVQAKYGPCLSCEHSVDLIIEMNAKPGRCFWMPASFSASDKPFLWCSRCAFQMDQTSYNMFREMVVCRPPISKSTANRLSSIREEEDDDTSERTARTDSTSSSSSYDFLARTTALLEMELPFDYSDEESIDMDEEGVRSGLRLLSSFGF